MLGKTIPGVIIPRSNVGDLTPRHDLAGAAFERSDRSDSSLRCVATWSSIFAVREGPLAQRCCESPPLVSSERLPQAPGETGAELRCCHRRLRISASLSRAAASAHHAQCTICVDGQSNRPGRSLVRRETRTNSLDHRARARKWGRGKTGLTALARISS